MSPPVDTLPIAGMVVAAVDYEPGDGLGRMILDRAP